MRRIQLIETTGEGKAAVATPDGKSRKKKKKNTYIILALHYYQHSLKTTRL